MQVGEVGLGAAGAVQRLHIGLELDQVAGDEARREAQVTQQLHHQPGTVAAGAAGLGEGFFGRLHPGLQPDQVADVVLQALIQADQEIDGARLVGRLQPCGFAGQQRLEVRAQGGLRRAGQVGQQIILQAGFIGQGQLFGTGFQEEIEGVVDGHLGHQVNRDLELAGLVGEDEAGQVIGEGVLLPVDEVQRGLHPQGIAEDARAAVRGRAQPHHLRRQAHQPVVAVVGDVGEGDVDGQGSTPAGMHDGAVQETRRGGRTKVTHRATQGALPQTIS